jgi:hypothetical protein
MLYYFITVIVYNYPPLLHIAFHPVDSTIRLSYKGPSHIPIEELQ